MDLFSKSEKLVFKYFTTFRFKVLEIPRLIKLNIDDRIKSEMQIVRSIHFCDIESQLQPVKC